MDVKDEMAEEIKTKTKNAFRKTPMGFRLERIKMGKPKPCRETPTQSDAK